MTGTRFVWTILSVSRVLFFITVSRPSVPGSASGKKHLLDSYIPTTSVNQPYEIFRSVIICSVIANESYFTPMTTSQIKTVSSNFQSGHISDYVQERLYIISLTSSISPESLSYLIFQDETAREDKRGGEAAAWHHMPRYGHILRTCANRHL